MSYPKLFIGSMGRGIQSEVARLIATGQILIQHRPEIIPTAQCVPTPQEISAMASGDWIQPADYKKRRGKHNGRRAGAFGGKKKY